LLHLSEVKGPVMDRLKSSAFLSDLGGRVFLTHYQAVQQLTPELMGAALEHSTPAPGVDPQPVGNR
jgi:SulP family sulfate permease